MDVSKNLKRKNGSLLKKASKLLLDINDSTSSSDYT